MANQASPPSFATDSAWSVDHFPVDSLAANARHHQHHIASAAQQHISLAQLSSSDEGARFPPETANQPFNRDLYHGQFHDNHESQRSIQPSPPQNENNIFTGSQETNNASLPNTWELIEESLPFSDCQDRYSIAFSSPGTGLELCEPTPATFPTSLNESPSSHHMGSFSLEARMERILNVVEEMNFENMDAMMTAYYTSKFKKDTLANWAQSTSRSRRIHKFLAELEQSTQDWSEAEVHGYREAMVRCAERHYVNEFQRHQQTTYRPSNNSDSPGRQRLLTEVPRQLCLDDLKKRLLRSEGQLLREQVLLSQDLPTKACRIG
jgi:hypothetical protein